MHYRIFVGGLTDNIQEQDLRDRFSSFGQINSIEIVKRDCFYYKKQVKKAFSFINLETTEQELKKLESSLNNTSWKGIPIKIELAKPDYKERYLETGLIKLEKSNKTYYEHQEDMSLKTDKNITRGWRRGKLGRAIAIVKLRRPDGKLVVVDPSHSKNNIERLFGSVKPLPVHKLDWNISKDSQASIDSDSDIKDVVKKQVTKADDHNARLLDARSLDKILPVKKKKIAPEPIYFSLNFSEQLER